VRCGDNNLTISGLSPGSDTYVNKGVILLVEDDVMVRLAAAELLRDCAYRVIESHDAKAAIEVLSSGELVDVVFSDVIMQGGINGFEFAAWVHAHYPHLPVILTSGYSNQRLIVEFQKYGTFMVKPYSYDALLANIERLMNQSASQ